MDTLWIAVVGAVMITAVLFVLKKVRFVEQWLARERFYRFNRVVSTVEQTNEAYFRSLEAMLKTLESLRAQTDEAEQRLWSIVAQPADERRERRQAAGLLVAGDVPSAGIAEILNARLGEQKSRQRAKAGGRGKQPSGSRLGAKPHRSVPVGTATVPVANKPTRTFARPETGTDNHADALIGDNKRARINGASE
jgi:hypothetical protein